MSIKARFVGTGKDRTLQITVPCGTEPQLSASKKSLVIASSHGNQATTLEVDGKPVIIGFNAYIRA